MAEPPQIEEPTPIRVEILLGICMILCNVAETYYKENRDKFHFNYEIIDWDEVTSHLPPIDMEKVFAELAKSDSEFYQGRKMGENE